MNHELMTHMLFIDAIVGVGLPNHQITHHAIRSGLATSTVSDDAEVFAWNRTALEELSTATLQDLYTGLKLHEVTHAS